MKVSHFFYILLAVLLFSCGEQNENNQFEDFGYNTNLQNNIFQKSSNKTLKPFYLKDPQFGIPFGVIQIPNSWKESTNTQENLLLEGPNGLKIFKAVSNYSSYNSPIKSIDQFINESIIPMAKKEGLRMVNQYPLQQMVQLDSKLDSYLYKSTPEQKQYQCIVTEWENQAGISSLIIIRYYLTKYQIGGAGWGYTLNGLEAPKSDFEEAKKSYINSLLNFQINPQWVQTHNQYWSQKNQKATLAHNQRMANIEAFGKANTALHNQRMAASDARFNSWKASQAASDAQYNSWRAGQASSDIGQSNYIDGIWEQRNMTNTNTGQTYKIEGYDDNVWMNQNNEYFGNDNSLYNPNLDNTINSENWTQLENYNN